MKSGRVFATSYGSRSALVRLYIPLMAACVLGMAGLYLNMLPLTLFSGVLTYLSLRNWPYSQTLRVVLRLTDAGVDIDGVGHIPWSNIARAGMLALPMPRIALRYIRIDLDGPIADMVQPAPQFARPHWQKTLGKIVGARAIAFSPNGLLDPPEDIADAFEAFLGERFYRMTPGAHTG